MQTSALRAPTTRRIHQNAAGIRPLSEAAGPFRPATPDQSGYAQPSQTLIPRHCYTLAEIGALDAPEVLPAGSTTQSIFHRPDYPLAMATFTFRG